MENSLKIPDKCPLCGTKMKKPDYICSSCNKYLNEDAVIKDKGSKARCPDCKLIAKQTTDDVLKEKYKCRECGLSLVEMLNLTKERPAYVDLSAREKLSTLEEKLGSLSEEIDRILAQTKEEEKDKFTCPECKTKIEIDTKICPGCGIDIIELDELPEVIAAKGDFDKFECTECGNLVNLRDDKCPRCGTVYVDTDQELIFCPKCNNILDHD
jgi:predicted RNA-binding Zn-ribbon protein involved in translation (DUF1610 family)